MFVKLMLLMFTLELHPDTSPSPEYATAYAHTLDTLGRHDPSMEEYIMFILKRIKNSVGVAATATLSW